MGAYEYGDYPVIVTFPDLNLEAKIREAIGKPTGDIYDTDLEGLTYLNAYSAGITDLTGLEYCTDLTHLNLNSNQISDISALSGLTNLAKLYLSNNQINDISVLSGLTRLTYLELIWNQISDISILSGLTNLTTLNLNSNQISDISPLSGLTKLVSLNLGSNQISDISALSGLNKLDYLSLSSNQISDISALSGLNKLTLLWLSYSQISDISPLSGLTKLVSLNLGSNQISDISALSGLTNLTDFLMKSNQVSDISALSGLTKLTYLTMMSNQISDISPLSGLTNLTVLTLNDNQISDISALSGLNKLDYLSLSSNQISDISALITNMGIDSGDTVDLRYNPLNCDSILKKIPILLARGVTVWWTDNDADKDDDGILDVDEDKNQNGIVDIDETDPCNIDSDWDGIQDGTELGITLDDIGPDTDTDIFQPDLDDAFTTDPLDNDTDGDGLLDGEEDANHNGRLDPGETDPLVPNLPSITVISPNGGEELFGDRTFEIAWTSFRVINNVKIEYSINNGTDWTEIVANTENDGSYTWDVPNNPSDSCLIRISDIDDDPSDVSDDVFTILLAPWYVDGEITVSGNGTSWTEVFKTIQEAIDAADADDIILVKQGTYFVNSTVNVTKSVSIYGGFDGTETHLSERDWRANVTTVDGQNIVRCFYVNDDASLDGFTIAHGKTNWGGGGMFISSSSPVVTNCTFLENTAGTNGGGAIHSWNALPIITNSLFLKNVAGSNGGGAIFTLECPAVIVTNCTFSENDGSSGGGGAIKNSNSSATVTNCILWNDLADVGNEAYNVGGILLISHCDLSGGMAGVVNVGGGSVIDGGNNMDDDPLFVDAHRLRPMSSCIDAGDNNAPELPVIDMDGNPRIIDGTVDMGAYESPGSFVEQTIWYTITP